jgi:HEAT repeat protein
MKSVLVLALASLPAIFATGCGKSQPTMAGGKPVDYWVQVLQSEPDAKVRKEAVFKLGNVGPADPAALPALIAALKDRDSRVRREAIMAVLKCGPAAKDAIPHLTATAQSDRDKSVREAAVKALEKIPSEN